MNLSALPLQYLNSGAGGIAGAFLHSRWFSCLPSHLHGWWSNKMNTRFRMDERVDLEVGADALRLCNPPPWLACLNMASLEVSLYRMCVGRGQLAQ